MKNSGVNYLKEFETRECFENRIKERSGEYKSQEHIKTCEKCKTFKKYGTLRLEKEGETICSVCGMSIK